jgi:hypothetical protein
MEWLTKLKDKAQEHTILGLFFILGLLCLVIWRAVPPIIWETISEATSKPALWALAGLLVIAAILELAYVCDLRQKLKTKKIWKFGVLWDKEQAPLCPNCQNHIGFLQDDCPNLWCPLCQHVWPLVDDNGQNINFTLAKRLLTKL